MKEEEKKPMKKGKKEKGWSRGDVARLVVLMTISRQRFLAVAIHGGVV